MTTSLNMASDGLLDRGTSAALAIAVRGLLRIVSAGPSAVRTWFERYGWMLFIDYEEY